MQSILDAINEWIKGILIGAINGNLSTMFGGRKRESRHNRNAGRANPARLEREHLFHDTDAIGKRRRTDCGACHYLCPML